MSRQRAPFRLLTGPVAYGIAVAAISALHYATSVQLVPLHEVFRRLYYLPIVAAATYYGPRAGLATAVFASVLYLPHATMAWAGWPYLEATQYGELILFNVVGVAAGVFAERLRAERNRYRQAALTLDQTLEQLKTSIEERLRVERLVTIGQMAIRVAHEIKNPLGALHGAVEILASEFPPEHSKCEFIRLAQAEIARIDSIITRFQQRSSWAVPHSDGASHVDLGDSRTPTDLPPWRRDAGDTRRSISIRRPRSCRASR